MFSTQQLFSQPAMNPATTPRKLILHAGPHKTGTSSIQAILKEHKFDAFYYPQTGQWYDGAHHNLVFSLVPELRRADGDTVEPPELLRLLQEELAQVQHDTLLISSEYLSQEWIHPVLEWLIGHDIVDPKAIWILVVERDNLSRAASLYNQFVKDPYIGETREPDQWLQEELSALSMESILTNLQKSGYTVEILPYEPADSLVKRFLLAVGAHEAELPEQIPWTNVSMNEAVLKALLNVNRTVADPDERIAHRTQLFQDFQPAFVPSSPQIFSCAREQRMDEKALE
ncbi:MAG: hypothetical protein FJ083_07065 [Cyanobacteria bacterium K_Offshore_surface_m2_239]|nr:hypothetical protein [Cyanobacteria bacterium K_Offshore_surface_m2_239]